MDFGKYEAIAKIGYDYANQCLDEWEAEGKLPTSDLPGTEGGALQPKKGSRIRRASI